MGGHDSGKTDQKIATAYVLLEFHQDMHGNAICLVPVVSAVQQRKALMVWMDNGSIVPFETMDLHTGADIVAGRAKIFAVIFSGFGYHDNYKKRHGLKLI